MVNFPLERLCQPWNSSSYCTRKSNCFLIFYISLQILSSTSIFKFYLQPYSSNSIFDFNLRASFARLSFQVNPFPSTCTWCFWSQVKYVFDFSWRCKHRRKSLKISKSISPIIRIHHACYWNDMLCFRRNLNKGKLHLVLR